MLNKLLRSNMQQHPDAPTCVRRRQVYIIEANPRASRTVPFVAKAIGHPVAKYASLLMAGLTLAEIGFTEEPTMTHVAVKEAVLPFDKFPGAPHQSTSDFPVQTSILFQRQSVVCETLARPRS